MCASINLMTFISDVLSLYNSLNKHPKTPTFGFYQLSHTDSTGIAGNQLSNSLIAFKKGSDDTTFSLADIECNQIHCKTIDDLKQNINNIDFSYKPDDDTTVTLQSLHENKINKSI